MSDNHNLSSTHPVSRLKAQAVSSGLVQASSQGLQFFLQLGSSIALARILSPRDFGLVAMVAAFVGLANAFKELGLSTATIQTENITHAQVSNLFWLNAAVGTVLTFVFGAMSPLLSRFYGEPDTLLIAIALSTTFTFNGFAVQHHALMSRQMRFLAISLIDIIVLLLSIGAAMTLALAGYGYWALVAAQVVAAGTRLILILAASNWWPRLPMRRCGTKKLIGFGVNLSLAGFVFSLARACDQLLIGRIYGSDAVGLYSRAAALLVRPLEQMISPIYTVVVPTLSRLQRNEEEYRRSYVRIFELLTISSYLFVGIILPLSHPLTLVILGAKWEGAVSVFAALSCAAPYLVLSSAASWLFTSQGRGQDMLTASAIASFVMVVSVIAGLPFGPSGVATAYAVVGLLVQLPSCLYLAGRSGPVSTSLMWTILGRQLPILIAVFSSTALSVVLLPSLNPEHQLAVALPAAGIAFAFTLLFYGVSRSPVLYIFSAVNASLTRRHANQ